MNPPAASVTAIVALLAGVLLGPAVLRLTHDNLLRPCTPGVVEQATVVAVTGLLTAVTASRLGPVGAAVVLPLVVIGPAAAVVDVRERRLPDALTGPLLGATLVSVAGASAVSADGAAALRSLAAAGVVTACALVSKVVGSGAIGWGDVKLVPSLGATLGWWRWDVVWLAAVEWMLLIGVTAAIVSCTRTGRSEVVPYGPALLAGTLGALPAAT